MDKKYVVIIIMTCCKCSTPSMGKKKPKIRTVKNKAANKMYMGGKYQSMPKMGVIKDKMYRGEKYQSIPKMGKDKMYRDKKYSTPKMGAYGAMVGGYVGKKIGSFVGSAGKLIGRKHEKYGRQAGEYIGGTLGSGIGFASIPF